MKPDEKKGILDGLLFEAVLFESLRSRELPVAQAPSPVNPESQPGAAVLHIQESQPRAAVLQRHRRLARWAAVAALVALSVALAALIWNARRYPQPMVEGDYEVVAVGRAGGGAGALARGSDIVAGPNGARLLMGGYCDLRLSPHTEVVLRGRERAEAVTLEQGALHAKVERHEGEFTVWTPLGSLSVVGTEFIASVERYGSAQQEGEGTMRSAAGRSSLVTVTVLSGIVGYAFSGDTGFLKAGESKVFAAEPPAVVAAPAPAPPANPPFFNIPGGRFLMMDMYQQPIILADRQGLFALNRGVVARYDPKTLALVKSVELFGPAPQIPKEGFEDYKQANQYCLEAALRTLPTAMIATDNDLLLVANDAAYCRYFRVDKATLTIQASPELIELRPGEAKVLSLGWGAHEPPLLAVRGGTLYVYRSNFFGRPEGPEVWAVDIATGKLAAKTDLPPQQSPKQWKPINIPNPIKNLYTVSQQPSVAMTATPQGVFLYRCGAVAEFDPQTLEFKGVAEPFGPVPNPPADAPKEEKEQAALERARRLLPAAMMVRGKDLLVVAGDRFFRMDTTNRAVTAVTPGVADAAQAKVRIEQLIAMGEPTLALTLRSLCVTRGRDLISFNLADGKVLAQQRLSGPMAQRLMDFPLPPLPPPPPPPDPVEGEMVNVNGLLEKHADAAGAFWTVHDNRYNADFIVKGDAFDKLLADHAADIEEQTVIAQGPFHAKQAGVPQFGKGIVQAEHAFVSPIHLFGTLVKHADLKGTFWTIKSQGGFSLSGEYVLVGDKARELAANPSAENARAFVMGKLKKQYPGVAPFGKGFIEVSSCQLQRPPEDAAGPD